VERGGRGTVQPHCRLTAAPLPPTNSSRMCQGSLIYGLIECLFRRSLYEWNTLLVCRIAVRQMGHDGSSLCVSRFAHAWHTHTWPHGMMM
jgi:hypothetical protein